MIRVTIYAYDRTKEYDVDFTYLIANKFRKRVLKNEIYVVNAAKLILIIEKSMKSLLIPDAIINVDSNGDLFVWTESKIKDLETNNAIIARNLSIVDIKNKLKTLRAKISLGLTAKEIIEISALETKFETYKLGFRLEVWEKNNPKNPKRRS